MILLQLFVTCLVLYSCTNNVHDEIYMARSVVEQKGKAAEGKIAMQIAGLSVREKFMRGVNEKNRHGDTPLMEVLKLDTAEAEAWRNILVEDASLRMDIPRGAGKRYLNLSIENGHTEVAKRLLERFPRLIKYLNSWVSNCFGKKRFLGIGRHSRGINEKIDERTPLIECAESGDINKLKALLLHPDVDVNATDIYDWPPVCIAACCGHADCIRALAACGADISQTVHNGWPAACIAAWGGHADCIRALAECSTDINQAMYNSWTPMCIAAQNGYTDCIRVLAELGADPNQAMEDGATPAYIAAEFGNADCVRLLAEYGVNLHSTMLDGRSPTYIASDLGRLNCIRALARPDPGHLNCVRTLVH